MSSRLEHVADWSLWVTVWGPVIAILLSFQEDIHYAFYLRYRAVVFTALVIQLALRLAQTRELDWRKTTFLAILATLHNPIYLVHLGSAWPWRMVNAATIVVSFLAVAEVADHVRSSRESKQ